MIYLLIYSITIGLFFGWFAEFSFISITRRKIIWPLFANVYMYGASSGFAYLLFFLLNPSIWIVALLGLIFTSGIEFLTGSHYVKNKGIRLWDYSTTKIHYKGILNPVYSFIWLMLFLVFYYTMLPVLISF